MIKFMEVEGQQKPAIIVNAVSGIGDVRELRKALVEIMETCLSDDKTKQFVSALSLWYLTRLIDETTIECPEEKGGQV